MKFLNVYSNCILVKGHKYCLICDLQNEMYYSIPKLFYQFLIEIKSKKIQYKELIHKYAKEKEGIKLFVNYFVSRDVLFFSQYINKNLVEYNLEWDYPAIITNSIIDISKNSNYNFDYIQKVLSETQCENICIRFLDNVSQNKIVSILNIFAEQDFKFSIQVVLRSGNEKFIDFLTKKFPLVVEIIIANYETEAEFKLNNCQIKTTKTIVSEKTCGTVNKDDFCCNHNHYNEANFYNSCLNRKLGIDSFGSIKNCPSMAESFGNVQNSNILKIVNSKKFQKKWHITKDNVTICKDCEYRYVCTDCRAYIENPKDIYSKPLKCGYNPYTGVWEEWSKNPLKQKAIEYYKM